MLVKLFVLALTFNFQLSTFSSFSQFKDETGKTVTANGNVQIDVAQSKFGGASGLFDGTGDYLSLTDNDDWNFGTGDYTIDFWVRFNNIPTTSTPMFFYSQYFDAGNCINFYLWKWATDNKYYLQHNIYSGGTWKIYYQINTWTPSTNTWYHLAVTRKGDTWNFWINGVKQVDYTLSGIAVPDFNAVVTVGSNPAWTTSPDGWIDEFRVSKGIARWTSDFTPPTSAYSYENVIYGKVGIGTTNPTSKLQVVGLPVYANNAAAIAGGLTAGAFYRTGADPDVVCVVH